MRSLQVATCLAMLLSTAACITKIDQPPPPSWTLYSENGASEREIKLAFLECGYPVPGELVDFDALLVNKLGFNRYDPQRKRYVLLHDKWLNAVESKEQCMLNGGFPSSHRYPPCQSALAKETIPSCQPGAKIPVRSMANRLNSDYCKLLPKSSYCKPE